MLQTKNGIYWHFYYLYQNYSYNKQYEDFFSNLLPLLAGFPRCACVCLKSGVARLNPDFKCAYVTITQTRPLGCVLNVQRCTVLLYIYNCAIRMHVFVRSGILDIHVFGCRM